MSEPVEFQYLGEKMVATANAAGSRLPVRLRNGTPLMVLSGAQGRSFHHMKPAERIRWRESPYVDLGQIKQGALADCQPRPVRIVATRFLVTLSKGIEYEIDQRVPLRPGQFLQGCYFRQWQERAVYFVSVPPPGRDRGHLQMASDSRWKPEGRPINLERSRSVKNERAGLTRSLMRP